MEVEADKLRSLVKEFNGKSVVVLGDLMLDHYVYTEPRKLSREAPVIVADYSSESYRPGGAGNLASILTRMGARAFLVGAVGLDDDADKLLVELKANGVDISGVITTNRRTCVKRRIYVGRRQYLRIDSEDRTPLEGSSADQLLTMFSKGLQGADLALISDHDKGTLTPPLIYRAVELAREAGKCVVSRPKVEHLFDYAHVDSVVATVREASEAVGVRILNDSSLRNLGFNMLTRMESGSVYLHDQHMSYLFEPNSVTYVPSLVKPTYQEAIGVRDIITAAYGLAYAASKSGLYASLISRAAESLYVEATNGARTQIGVAHLEESISRFFGDGYSYRTVKVR
ncbi:MAG: PfkB family carbohydrate kinase [Thermoprotei archaeon]